MTTSRVAVIAVHGVADQQPGDTARAVVDLLVSSAPEGTCYTSASSEDLSLRVPPLPPQGGAVPDVERESQATPSSEDRPVAKSFQQSLRSDFHRHGWAEDTPPAAPGAAAAQAELGVPAVDKDRGIALTNYLLAKHLRNGAMPETYDTACIALQRHGVGPEQRRAGVDTKTADVDVYEMYWADLSRLSGSMPRIVSELFTLVFRLSKLGRGTVDEMGGQLARSRDPRAPWAGTYAWAWRVLAGLQIALDWLFVNGLALLFTQLALLGVLLVFLGFTSGIAPEIAGNAVAREAARTHQNWLHMGIASALIVLAALRLLYRRGDGRWLQVAAPLAVIALAAAALVAGIVSGPGLLQWLTAATFLLLLTLANQTMLRIADDRFPLVHAAGSWLWGGSALLMVASAIHEMPGLDSEQWREVWVHAALFATETVLLVIKWWWIVAGPLLLVWFVAGQVARLESGYASRASVATGRLGITVSVGMFLVMTMTIWALGNNVLSQSVDGVGYQPCVFAYAPVAGDPLPASTASPNACMWTSRNAVREAAAAPMPTASTVLYDRYANSTSAFSVLATLLMLLVAWLLVMFTPSVLAELKLIVDARRDAHRQELDRRRSRSGAARPAEAGPDRRVPLAAQAQRARELGRWLTAGYRRLDLAVAVVTAFGVVLSVGITLVFLSTIWDHDKVAAWIAAAGLTDAMGWIGGLQARASGATRTIFAPLQALVFSAAGIGATLSVLGGTLSRRIPSLRGPLDVAMDVDNHFREFPRTDIPRAHIFSRYAALLEHVRTRGYDRIVVVSHSQGTVISAELLRFLSSRDQAAPRPGDTPMLHGNALPPFNLLTLGCPLRQLYAARFPGLYAWVLARNGDMFGPRAADVGVQRWMNAFCSGDYVGRWLWSHAGDAPVLRHPTDDTLEADPFGRADAYTGFDPMPPVDTVLDPAREAEVCLGLGAHTHYLERDQATVAWMIDYLVRARPPGDDAGAPGTTRAVPTVVAAAGRPAAVVPAQASVVSDGTAAPAVAPDGGAPSSAPLPAPPAS
ncbi:MAG: hypothetical protein ACJ8IK_11105 [Burkholderiaceae bacterium]